MSKLYLKLKKVNKTFKAASIQCFNLIFYNCKKAISGKTAAEADPGE